MVIPSMRGVKISDNQSPRPQDRVYFSFNYFQGVNDQVNQKLQAPIGYTQVFRYIVGFEKTFFDGQALDRHPGAAQQRHGDVGRAEAIRQLRRQQHRRRRHEHLCQVHPARGSPDRQPALGRTGDLSPDRPGQIRRLELVRQHCQHDEFSAISGLYLQLWTGFMSTVSSRSTSRPIPRT